MIGINLLFILAALLLVGYSAKLVPSIWTALIHYRRGYTPELGKLALGGLLAVAISVVLVAVNVWTAIVSDGMLWELVPIVLTGVVIACAEEFTPGYKTRIAFHVPQRTKMVVITADE